LHEVLQEIIADAAWQFRPTGRNVKDQDIDHLSRQTAVLNDLLRIYKRIDPAREYDSERAAFRESIESIQRALYPWITAGQNGRKAYRTFFDLLNSYNEEVGIVISVGKDGGFRWAIHQIVTLRAVIRSNIPIEVFYGGDMDLPKEYREFIDEIQSTYSGSGTITIIDIKHRFPDPDGTLGLPGGWALRPFAMLASSFKRVILSDADTIFLQDPRIILDEPGFQQYGSIFWHDRILETGTEKIYNWADELLEKAKAKNLDRVRDENPGWFSRTTFYELERYHLNPLSMLMTVGCSLLIKLAILEGC
jgi:hypothetical protein